MNGAVRLLAPLTFVGFWIWSLDVLLHDWEAHTTCLPGQEAGLGPLLLISRIVVIAASAAVGVWLGLRDPNRQLATRALQTLLYALPFALVMASVAPILLPPTAERWMSRSIFLASLGLAQIVWSLHWGTGATSPSDRVATRAATKAVKERYRLQQWLTWRVTARLLSLARLTPDERERVARIGADGGQPGEVPAWIEDPGLEISTMTESRFLEVETRRRRITDPSDAKIAQGYDQLFAGLRHFHSLLEERLLVVLIPDEFQLNDALWETLGGDAPGLDRTLPQQRILAFCTDRDIERLDLLPVLRAAEPSGRTYHLRDTHWNARGNLAAGSALARAIADELRSERGLGTTKTATP